METSVMLTSGLAYENMSALHHAIEKCHEHATPKGADITITLKPY